MSLIPPLHDHPQHPLDTIKNAAAHSAIFVGKCIAIPVECALLALAVGAAALSAITSLPLHLIIYSKSSITPFHYTLSAIDALLAVIKITYHFGVFPASETLQLVDDMPDSPYFVKILPSKLSNAPPILYAPGYLDAPYSLRDTCRKVAEDSSAPVYIIKYRTLFQSIEEHAKDIARLEDRIIKDTGTKDVILIGHSMGGINTGRFIQQLQPDQVNVKLWITLASPLEGTPLATYGYGKCSQDMKPTSSLIGKLQTEGTLENTPSLHIYTLTDGIVSSESAAGPKGVLHTAYQCKQAYSHLGMRSRSEVYQQIQNAIKRTCEN